MQNATSTVVDLQKRLEKGTVLPVHAVGEAVDSARVLFYAVLRCIREAEGMAALQQTKNLIHTLRPLVPEEYAAERQRIDSLVDLCERVQA